MALKIELYVGGPIDIKKAVNEFLAKIGDKFVDIKMADVMGSIGVLVIYEE